MYPSRKECRAMIFRLFARLFALCTVLASASLLAQSQTQTIDGWQMQDSANVVVPASLVSTNSFDPQGWYAATVPGTVLTTLVNDGVYPEPLYGENMRAIPESLNKTSYWYRTTFTAPAAYKGRHIWLHFAGINYAAEVWVNGHQVGTIRGAFIRGDFDVSEFVKAGGRAVLDAVRGADPVEAAEEIATRVRAQVSYMAGATGVRTNAQEAWDQGEVVCQ